MNAPVPSAIARRASALVLTAALVLGSVGSVAGQGAASVSHRYAAASPRAGRAPTSALHPGRGTVAASPTARHGAVAAEHPKAAEIGLEMLRRGGNAVDAAIATAYAVCVLNVSSCGLGGGGFMLIQTADGHVDALDYRETAPGLAHRDLYRRDGEVLGDLSKRGALAVAVPGEVAGLEAARQRFARLPRPVLMAPAIALARDGFPVGAHLATEIVGNAGSIRETRALAALFLRADGSPKREGEMVRFPALASTLERIARDGTAAFYRGPVAEAIVGAVRAEGGILTLDDLASYRPLWRAPLAISYRDLTIFTMPPPSSGGVLLEILHVLAADDLAALGRSSPAYLHLLAEAMAQGFADRAHWYGDPAFTSVPLTRLLSPGYGRELRARIRPDATLPPERAGSPLDHGTTHLSVIDGEGNAVGCTTTINTAFGAMLVGGASGVLLNNEMDDFAIAPGVPNVFGLVGEEANAVAPGKRPLSSMAPVIARAAHPGHDGRGGAHAPPARLLVAGGSGGPLILSAVLQTIIGMVDFGLEPAAAIAAPRIHDQWAPPVVAVEAGIDSTVLDDLRQRGHTVRPLTFAGAVQVVVRRGNELQAAADPRKGGGGAIR